MPGGIRLNKRAAADIETPPTDKVLLYFDDTDGPGFIDDTGTFHPSEGSPGTPGTPGAPGDDAPATTYADHGNTGSSEVVDWSAADIHRLVANAASVAVTYTGIPAAGTPGIIQLWLAQDGTGGRDWDLGASLDWGDFGEPDWTTRGPNHVDLVNLETVDGGTVVVAGLAGRPGDAGADGADGTVGGAISIPYTFDTTTTNSDPGAGKLRLSNATQTSAVTIRADLLDNLGSDWTAVLDSLADASNTVKGHIRLFKVSDPSKWLLFTVSAVATPSGYRNITVANIAGSASSPFSNADAISLEFTRSGDQGSTVGAGTLTTVEELDGSPTDSAVTKLVVPNGSLAIASHVATLTFPAAASSELDYVQITSDVNLTATTEGTANTCITGTSQAYAAVPTIIEVFCPRLVNGGSGSTVVILLFDGATVVGRLGLMSIAGISTWSARYRLTPTAATHQYIVKGYGTVNSGNIFQTGTGGTGVEVPAHIRIFKA